MKKKEVSSKRLEQITEVRLWAKQLLLYYITFRDEGLSDAFSNSEEEVKFINTLAHLSGAFIEFRSINEQ